MRTPRGTTASWRLLTFGEGYHNFHHMFAHDYRNGVRWWQWDPSKWCIYRHAVGRADHAI